MSVSRKALFGASIVMFVISVVHLGLVMQEVTLPRAPEANRKIQIVLSAFQVCPICFSHHAAKIPNHFWTSASLLSAIWFSYGGRLLSVCYELLNMRSRVWHIWERNCWIVVVPLATMVTAAGGFLIQPSRYANSQLFTTTTKGLTFNLAAENRPSIFFLVAPTALIVSNTIICTLLLAGRIWCLVFIYPGNTYL